MRQTWVHGASHAFTGIELVWSVYRTRRGLQRRKLDTHGQRKRRLDDNQHGHRGERHGETEAMQQARRVRTDLNAGASRGQCGRLLEDMGIEAGAAQ